MQEALLNFENAANGHPALETTTMPSSLLAFMYTNFNDANDEYTY